MGEDGICWSLAGPQEVALGEVEIEVAVSVVVEESSTASHVLGVVELPTHTAEVHEVDTGLAGAVDEKFGGWRSGIGRWIDGGWVRGWLPTTGSE